MQDRRDFLLGLGKWSMVVISVAAAGTVVASPAEAGWINSRGGWINGRGGGGGGWINGGGGGWINAR